MAKALKTALRVATADVSGKVFERIGFDNVDPNALKVATDAVQPFYDPADRHDLAIDVDVLASIKAHGVVTPIAVAESAEGGLWVIDGRQRRQTAIAARVKLVPIVKYRIEGYSKIEAERLIMEMNRMVQGVEDVKAAAIAKRWLEEGVSREDAARSMRVTLSKFDAFIALANAPDVVREAVENNVISTSAAAIIANESPEKAAAIIERAVEIRQEIVTANPNAKKPEAAVSNIDIRTAAAESKGAALPASAARKTDAVTKPKGPRTGAFNAEEITAFKDAVLSIAGALAAPTDPTITADPATAAILKACAQALFAVATGDESKLLGTTLAASALKAAFAGVRLAPAAPAAAAA